MGARTAETKSCGPQVVTSSGYGRSGSSSVKMPAHSCIGRLGRGAGSGRAVIGRAWRIDAFPSAHAHSTSCGRPKCCSIAAPRRASRRSTRSGRARTSVAAAPSTCSVPPPERARIITSRRPWRRSAMFQIHQRFRNTKRSGVTWPDTTASPKPGLASMTISSRAPVTGLAVNITPAISAGTICCTTTASLIVCWSIPWRSR